MASEQTTEYHLSQEQIPDIVSIIKDLEAWLAGAEFKLAQSGEIGKCVEFKADQRNRLDALFVALGIKSQIDNNTIGYAILRFPGPAPALVEVGEAGWADLVPMRIISSNPFVSDKKLVIGELTHINGEVWIRPALDCLVLTGGQNSSDSTSKSESKSKSKSKSGSKSESKSKSGSKSTSKSASKSSS